MLLIINLSSCTLQSDVMTDKQITFDALSGLSINRLRGLLKPMIEELFDEFLRSNGGRNMLLPIVEISCVQRVDALVEVIMQRYFTSEVFWSHIRNILIQNGAFQPPSVDAVALCQESQPSEVKISTNSPVGVQEVMLNPANKKRRIDLDMESKTNLAALDIIAWGIFAKIQFQYDKYMKETCDESERHLIQCQAYSVVKANCRRSSEIKIRVQRFVLEYIESANYPNSGLDKQAIERIKSAIYDASSKYKISLTC